MIASFFFGDLQPGGQRKSVLIAPEQALIEDFS